jgi:hypothetical protein
VRSISQALPLIPEYLVSRVFATSVGIQHSEVDWSGRRMGQCPLPALYDSTGYKQKFRLVSDRKVEMMHDARDTLSSK